MRIVHYINQFFGGIGGEEKADVRPELRPGPVGPGQALNAALAGTAEIVATVICGDSWFNENLEEAKQTVLDLIRQHEPDLVIAGPAFNAGRYGMACGAVAEVVSKNLKIPVVTGMYPENPGVEVYRRYAWVVETGNSAASMRTAVPAMAALVKRLAAGLEPEPGTYLERGLRVNEFVAERGSARAVAMLVQKLKGEPYTTEYPMPSFDRVPPNPPVKDLSKAKIALVTSGGIVPKGNPDHIESSSASKFGKYYLGDTNDLTAETHQTAHGGYDPTYANADADRVLPVDVMRELEREGVIGKLHDYWYATVGNGTSVANARAYAQAIAEDLRKYEVDAVILTST
ncbi:glycine reductase [Symbiobacterium terraclitae]|uniref:Glycine reductase n=2 Tax=Symbiobacterium terraclitae TaxID=557451 RepID=A0ABS4JWR8_9FIRM|nr:glycine reductase [Symbiobacterium terraclitae]